MPYSPLLILHASAGTLGLLSGTVAASVRKGSRTHARTGIVFCLSMLTLAASGTYLGYAKSQTSNIIGGLVTIYMIATAWIAGRRREQQRWLFDWVALLFGVALMTGCFAYGFSVATGRAHPHDGVPAGMDFFFGSVVLIATAGDVRMLAHGGISGSRRIACHLWRMCFGLFIASGSFFMGRQRLFPALIHKSFILEFLTVLPLLLLIFWLIRVRSSRAFARELNSPTKGVYSTSL